MRAYGWIIGVTLATAAFGAKPKAPPAPWVTPELPGGVAVLTVNSADLLHQPPEATVPLKDGVKLAKTPPTVDFAFFPGQTYRGNPWSNWSDGCVLNGKYYTALSDHLSPGGSAYVYEFDPATKKVRMLSNVRQFLLDSHLLATNEQYTPGKIHSRVMAGRDGWLYYTTHRGNPREATAAFGYRGDWFLRTLPDADPAKVKTEVVMAYPVPKHSMPASTMDTNRLVYYVGTAHGPDAPSTGVMFVAIDAAKKTVKKAVPKGFDRYAMFARSNGCVYWNIRGDNTNSAAAGLKYDPATDTITSCPAVPHVRACTEETADGKIYGVSGNSCDLWVFDTKTETLKAVGPGAVGQNTYTTSIDIDPTGRFLYYVPAAHGGGPREGTPVIQYDLKTNTRKVIAFMNVLAKQAGATFEGSFSTALNEAGDTLFVTWNMGRPRWDCCGVTAIHIPASERN